MDLQQLASTVNSQLPPLNGTSMHPPIPNSVSSQKPLSLELNPQQPLPNDTNSHHPLPNGLALQRPLPPMNPGPPPVDPLRTTFSVNLDTLATINALCQVTLCANDFHHPPTADTLRIEAKRTLAKQVIGKIAFPQVPQNVHWAIDNLASRGIAAAGEVAHLKARLEERRLRLGMPGPEKLKIDQALWELDAPRGVNGWEACVKSVREWVGVLDELDEAKRAQGEMEEEIVKMEEKVEVRDVKQTIEKDVEKNGQDIIFIVSTEMASETWTDSEDDLDGIEDLHGDDEEGSQGILLDGKAVIFKNMTPESFERESDAK